MNPDNSIKRSSKSKLPVFRLCSAFLFLLAAAVFVWLITDPVRASVTRHILFSSAFLVFSLALLLYSLFAPSNPRVPAALLWTGMGIGTILFIIGLFTGHPEPQPVNFDDGTPPQSIVIDE